MRLHNNMGKRRVRGGRSNIETRSNPDHPPVNINPPALTMPESNENPDAPVTYAQLEAALNKVLGGTLTALQSSIDAISKVAENALALAQKLEARVKALEDENLNLKASIGRSEKEMSRRLTALEEKVEERTNRQLRKTLVIRGMEEKAADQPPETWEETRVAVAKIIAKTCPSIDENHAYDIVERAHRSNKNSNYQGNAPRPVFAAITYWPDTVTITDEFRKKNIEDRNFKIAVDYKYGPMTTKRRSLAFQERRKLINNKEAISAYVAYPARLMIKTTQRGKYSLAKDFSKVKVDLGKKD